MLTIILGSMIGTILGFGIIFIAWMLIDWIADELDTSGDY